MLNENIKAFKVLIGSLRLKITICLARKAQITLLLAKKVTVLAKYLDLANIFLKKLANIFPEQTGANMYAIKLEKSKQLPYKQNP